MASRIASCFALRFFRRRPAAGFAAAFAFGAGVVVLESAEHAEARGGDDGPDVSLPLSSPHGAVATDDLALDDGGAKVALAGIIGRFDLAGPICEGKELLPGAGEPVSELHRQFARRARRDDVVDGSFERASSCRWPR